MDMKTLARDLLVMATKGISIPVQLRAVRERLGLNQTQVADRMDTVQHTISAAEVGKRNISLRYLERHAKALGLRVVLMPLKRQAR